MREPREIRMNIRQLVPNPILRIASFVIISSLILLITNAFSLKIGLWVALILGSILLSENRSWNGEPIVFTILIILAGIFSGLLLYFWESTSCTFDFWKEFPEVLKARAYCSGEIIKTRAVIETLVFLAPTGLGLVIYVFERLRQIITKRR